MRRAPPFAIAALLLLAATPARAVVVASGDGTQNTTAPADDPGWANVGIRNGLSAVYLGNRWVLTAAHVGMGQVSFAGVSYDPIPASVAGFTTAPGQVADLIAFRLYEDPGLPALELAGAPAAVGSEVILIGRGRNRGATTQWSGIDGWLWGAGSAMRWGTNRISANGTDVSVGGRVTRTLETHFTQSPRSQVTEHEAQAASGDSGGALFVEQGGDWKLGGVMYAISTFANQPAGTSLYGNLTLAVDLSYYRSAILAVVSRPSCSDGLDDDGDGLADFPADPGCSDAGDLDERSPLLACDDGADNDGDGVVDFGADPGCRDPAFSVENPPCQNGLDDDGALGIDFDGGAAANGGVALTDPDPQCTSPWLGEAPAACGLGLELLALIPGLALWHRRRAARCWCHAGLR